MHKFVLFIFLNFLIFQVAFGITARDLTVQAIEFTVNSKIESKVFNISGMISVDSMLLLKDGRKHRFSFQDAPYVWINYLYDDELGPGQFEWKSETREGKPPGGKIIHKNYTRVYGLLTPLEGMVDAVRLKQGTYSLGDGSYQGIPCYKISVRYPNGDDVISTTSYYNFDPNYIYRLFKVFKENKSFYNPDYHLTKEFFNSKREEFREQYFARIQLLVDKTSGRPFIYALEAFNKNGKKIYSMDWGKVRFPEQIDPNEFKLPGNNIITVGNHNEFARQNRINFRKLYTKNEPGWLSRIFTPLWNGITDNLDNIFAWSGKIAFWLAVAAAILAVVMKIYAKYKMKVR